MLKINFIRCFTDNTFGKRREIWSISWSTHEITNTEVWYAHWISSRLFTWGPILATVPLYPAVNLGDLNCDSQPNPPEWLIPNTNKQSAKQGTRKVFSRLSGVWVRYNQLLPSPLLHENPTTPSYYGCGRRHEKVRLETLNGIHYSLGWSEETIADTRFTDALE